jgi:uncharacterized delta-60 repeat protein
LCLEKEAQMNPKISWSSGLALTVLLVSVALTACGYKTTTYSQAPTAVALARYNANGTPDTTNLVGGTGLVTTDVNTSQDDIAFAVVRQPADGKIIAVGTSFTTPASVVVIRYNVDGTRDSTFGSNGITVTSLPSADASAFAATLQADGKLLVAGRSCPLSGSSSFLLLRYHTNSNGITGTAGALDTAGFNSPLGYVVTSIPSGTKTGANAVAVSGTNILVAGQSLIGVRFVIALAQYTSTGALDNTFGGTGIVTTPIGSGDAAATALAVQGDAKIVAAGLAGNAMSQIWDVALLRYNANGSLDTDPTTGFGGGTGIVTTDIGSSSNYANAVALQTDGKIVVVGNAFVNSFAATSDIAVLRYNTNGSLDTDPTTGFGGGTGIVTTNVGAFDNGFAVAVQPDNKIVVAGNADAGTGDRLALLRYNADGSPDSGFGTGGIVTRAASGPSIVAGAFGVLLQPGGEIVVAGYD